MKVYSQVPRFSFLAISAGLLLALLAGSCTDPITVGSDLLDDDRIEVDFNGDVPISTRTVQMDTFSVFDAGANSLWPRAPFGAVTDDAFGRYASGLHMFFRPLRSGDQTVAIPEFIEFRDRDSVRLDSVVVILAVDTNSFYGPIDETTFEYELRTLNGQPNFDEDIRLTDRLSIGDIAGLESSFLLTDEETLLADTLIRPDSSTAVHQRFRLNQQIIDQLASLDTADFASDSTFVEAFPGLFLEAIGESAGVFNFDMSSTVNFDGMIAYYTDTVGSPRKYDFLFTRRLPTVSRDRTGSTAEMLLDEDDDDVITFIEANAGLLTEIRLTDLTEFENRVINQAQLEIFPADISNFEPDRFPEPLSIMLFSRDADGRLQQIDDLSPQVLANPSISNIRFFVGGVFDEDADPPKYELNMSIQLQRILEGEAPPEVYLAIIPRISDPFTFLRNEIDIEYGRLPLNGPAAATNKMQLRVAYTTL